MPLRCKGDQSQRLLYCGGGIRMRFACFRTLPLFGEATSPKPTAQFWSVHLHRVRDSPIIITVTGQAPGSTRQPVISAPSWITRPPATMMANPIQVEAGMLSPKTKRPHSTLVTANTPT